MGSARSSGWCKLRHIRHELPGDGIVRVVWIDKGRHGGADGDGITVRDLLDVARNSGAIIPASTSSAAVRMVRATFMSCGLRQRRP